MRFAGGLLPAAALCLGAALAGCAPSGEALRGELSSGARSGRCIPLQFVKQKPERCGSAALAEVLGFWAAPECSEERLAAETYSPELGGARNTDLAAAARRRGLVVRSGPSDLGELRRAVGDGYPAVVLITLSPHLLGRKHYLAVKGVDAGEGWLLADYGFRPDMVLRPGPFSSDWRSAGCWALYCWPPTEAPEWSTALEDLRAGLLLEAAGDSAAAGDAYRRAAGKDPRLWEAPFNLGNLELARKRFEPALAAYRRALEVRPDEPDIMNNLAWTLQEFRQEPEEAESLARRALKMSPPASASAARAAHTLGEVLAWRGRVAEAREAFLRAIREAGAAGDQTTAAEARAALEKLPAAR